MPQTYSKTIETGFEYRSLKIDQRSIDEEARTVEVAFSSEDPVDRWFGKEILDHSPSSVRLGRLNNGGPILMDHDRRDHVGVVESATIESDRKGRALVRFGKSARAMEAFQDVVDRIRKHVSVGYRIHKIVLEEENDKEGEIYRATDWEPYEISFVSVPADATVGVGRSTETKFKTEVIMPKNQQPAPGSEENRQSAPAAPAPSIDVSAEVEKRARAELDRIDTIRKMGDKYECADLARQHIDDKKSADEMTRAVLALIAERQKEEKPTTQIGLSGRETQEYSLMRAMRALATNDWSKAGFEREASLAIADALGKEARGFFVPYEIQSRVMTTGVAADGGNLVGTDHMAGSFIDFLYANSVLGKLNAIFLEGLVGDIDIPRLDGGGAFTWVAEDGDGTDDDGVLGTVAMSPHTIAGAVPISRRLLKQSSPSVEAMIQRHLGRNAGLAIDLGGLQGTGASNQPTGISQTTGVGTVTIASAGSPTWAELVEFETDVATANGLDGSTAYVTTAGVRGNLKTTKKDAGSGIFLMEKGEANGHPVEISNQLAANSIIFGNYQDVVIGMWGVLDLVADTATKAASGGLVLRAFQDVDVGIAHAGSFSVNA